MVEDCAIVHRPNGREYLKDGSFRGGEKRPVLFPG
uniref:Uncharacterized protein n=1 Tax=Rhizophora mucronata TaxID=61149 RepID=A0A2P2QNL9_RHIMU